MPPRPPARSPDSVNTPTARRHAAHLLDSPSSSRISSLATPDELSGSYFPLSSQDSAQSSLFDCQSIAGSSSAPTSSCSSDRDVSPPVHAAMLKSAAADRYSSVYAHARALLRYAAGVDPAETEAGLTITGATTASHGGITSRWWAASPSAWPSSCSSANPLASLPTPRSVRVRSASSSTATPRPPVSTSAACPEPARRRSCVRCSTASRSPRARPAAARLVPRVAFVNCMTLSHPRLIFAKVLQALGSNAAEGQSDAVAEAQLSTLIRDGNQRILIVLDEMDHLSRAAAHQNILYKLFSCANNRGCSLIGIANSLDLTERFVPLLASKGASPALLHFRPFEANEIVSVIRDRLSGLHARYDDDSDEHSSSSSSSSRRLPKQTRFRSSPRPPSSCLPRRSPARRVICARRSMPRVWRWRWWRTSSAKRRSPRLKPSASRLQPTPRQCRSRRRRSRTWRQRLHLRRRPRSMRRARDGAAPPHAHKRTQGDADAHPQGAHCVLGSPNLSKVRSLGVHPKLVLLAVLCWCAGACRAGSRCARQPWHERFGGWRAAHCRRRVDVSRGAQAGERAVFAARGSELLGVFDMLEVNGVIRISSDVEALSGSGAGGAV